MDLTKLNPPEKSRVYRFPQGESVELKDITEFYASTTTHRLKTADGKLHIVPHGWLHIEIDAGELTV